MNDRLPPPPPPLHTVTSFYIIPVRLGGGHTLRPLSFVLFKHNRGTRAAVQCATQFIKYVWYALHLYKFYYKHYCCYALTGTCLDFCSGNEIIVRVRLLTVTNLRFLACGHVTSLVHGFFKTFCSLRCYPTLYEADTYVVPLQYRYTVRLNITLVWKLECFESDVRENFEDVATSRIRRVWMKNECCAIKSTA